MSNESNTHKKENTIQALIDYKGIVSDACKKVGISRKTFYEWIKEDPEFAAAVEDAKEQAIDFVEGRLFNLIENEDTTATIFFLKTRGKNRGYREKEDETPPAPPSACTSSTGNHSALIDKPPN